MSESLINAFFADQNVQRLFAATATWEPLQICFPKEINVSRFLGWVLDPSQGHGLGDAAIRSLLTRAWQKSDEAILPLAVKRFLSPSNTQTEAFSAVLVATEVSLKGRSLDLLVVDPNSRKYIAIENKFGASQSAAQLKDYRKGLEKLLPDFIGVHILLDSNEAEPDDSAWIPIGYDWLSEFLLEAEQREATALHVRQALGQFRKVIQEEDEEATGSSPHGRLITEVARSHPDVINLMSDWIRKTGKSERLHAFAELQANATTLDAKATLRLFHMYWRRPAVWEQCLRQILFSPFVALLRGEFQDLLLDPKRVQTTFSLGRWKSFIDQEQFGDDWFFPAGVTVRQTGETFRVTTYLHLAHVLAERKDAMRQAAISLRRGNINRRLGEEQSWVAVRKRSDLPLKQALDFSVEQLRQLQSALDVARHAVPST